MNKELINNLQFQNDLYESLITNLKRQIKIVKKLNLDEKEIHGSDRPTIFPYPLAPDNAVPVYAGKRIK